MIWNDTYLNASRMIGDKPADDVVSQTMTDGARNSLFDLLKLNDRAVISQPSSPVRDFLLTRKENPSWFDEDRFKKGQRLFENNALEIMTLLGIMALPYCYAAAPGNKALYLSDKMRNTPGKRLMDTASFVIHVLTPGSPADDYSHIHINKVRLIHAVSRYYLLKHGAWDMRWGVPINQEDMAGTNLAFSYIILLGLQQSGISLSSTEKDNFIFTWRYIGYLLHIDEALLPDSFQQAKQLTDLIQKRNFQKTSEGIALTSELLNFYRSGISSWQSELVAAQIRHYVGGEVADCIGIKKDPIRDTMASWFADFQTLRNMFAVRNGSYGEMLSQHQLFKSKFS